MTPEQIEKCKKEFENFCKIEELSTEKYCTNQPRYVFFEVQQRWIGWLASRKALCVELPELHSCCHCGDSEAFDDGVYMKSDILLMLESAGIKVKE